MHGNSSQAPLGRRKETSFHRFRINNESTDYVFRRAHQVWYSNQKPSQEEAIGLTCANFPSCFSGLDSSSSVQVVSHLKALSRGGRTIVCVIHQPSSRLFEMFDDIYLLVDGQCLYNGTVDDMVPVLENAGFKCPKYYNRADFGKASRDSTITRFTFLPNWNTILSGFEENLIMAIKNSCFPKCTLDFRRHRRP